jgi:MscS family membrane protein
MVLLYGWYRSTSLRLYDQNAALYFAAIAFPIAAMLIPMVFLYLADSVLAVRSTPIEVIRFASYSIALLAAVFVIFAVASRLAALLISLQRATNPGRDALIHISAKLIAVIVTLALLTLGGQFLGIPVTTLLASAGIGGIAVALAAQDTLKNLFATLTLMADRPCSVGDLIKIDEFMGFVEDIGMRTAKLRLVDGTLLAIPNELLAGQKVENLTRSRHIRRKGEIQIPLDTPSEKLDRAVAIIREKLENDECMYPSHCSIDVSTLKQRLDIS